MIRFYGPIPGASMVSKEAAAWLPSGALPDGAGEETFLIMMLETGRK